ncbi:MAG: 30S ribosomal protein S9 [bacterium]|nr:30S ribosomal protein S9 [bacterium]
MAKKSNKATQIWATGRRKKAIARVRIMEGSGKITVNKVSLDEYFAGNEILKTIATQAISLVGALDKYDVFVNVYGGGLSGQAGAIRHGIARALVLANENYKPEIKAAGFLSRDPRMKERKKYGLKKARKAPQFSKR